MVQAMKDDRMRGGDGNGRMSKATEYDENEGTEKEVKDIVAAAAEIMSDSQGGNTEDEHDQ